MTGEGTDPNAGTYHPQTQTTVQTTATSTTGTASTEQTRATEIGASTSTRQAPQAQKTQAPPTPSEEQFANQPVRSIKVGNVTVLDRYPAEYKEWYEKNTPNTPAPSDFYYSWDVQPNSNLPALQAEIPLPFLEGCPSEDVAG